MDGPNDIKTGMDKCAGVFALLLARDGHWLVMGMEQGKGVCVGVCVCVCVCIRGSIHWCLLLLFTIQIYVLLIEIFIFRTSWYEAV